MLSVVWEKLSDEWFMSTIMAWVLLVSLVVLHLQEVVDWIEKE